MWIAVRNGVKGTLMGQQWFWDHNQVIIIEWYLSRDYNWVTMVGQKRIDNEKWAKAVSK